MDEGQLIWKGLGILSVLANIAMGWVMWQSRNAKNTTSIEGEVSTRAAKDFVTKDHHDTEIKRLDKRIDDCQAGHKEGDGELEEDVQKLGDKIDKVKDALEKDSKDRTGKLHARMDKSDQTLARVDERSATTESNLRIINQDIKEILKEVKGR